MRPSGALAIVLAACLVPAAAQEEPEPAQGPASATARLEWAGPLDLSTMEVRGLDTCPPRHQADRVPHGFRFASDLLTPSCAEVVLTTRLPAGTEGLELRFMADRVLLEDPLDQGLAGFEQSVRLHGDEMQAQAYHAPEAGPSDAREFTVTFDADPGRQEIAWYFHDDPGRRASARVWDVEMSVPSTTLEVTDTLRRGLDADLVRSGELTVVVGALPELDLRPWLVATLRDDAIAGDVRAPDGTLLALEPLDTPTGKDLVIGPDLLRAHGPGTYRIEYQVPAPLASAAGLTSAFVGILVLLPTAVVLASVLVEGYARTVARDRPVARRTARGAAIVLGVAALLAIIQTLLRQDPRIMVRTPLHPVAAAQYTALAGTLLLLVVLMFAIGAALIRALRRRLRERTRQQQQLEAANRELEDYAAATAHDLAGPLKSLRLTAQLLERSGAARDPEHRRLLKGMEATSERMTGLVQAMLRYARLNDARPAYAPLHFKDLAEPVLEDLRAPIAESHADVRFAGNPRVTCDEALMRRALQNLVENAIKYSDGRPWVRLRARNVGSDTLISVADHGRGIAAEEQQRVMEPFGRGASSKGREGTGLGLASVRRIAQLHGGELEVRSRPGHGTTFTMRLPTTPTGPPETASETSASRPARPTAPRPAGAPARNVT